MAFKYEKKSIEDIKKELPCKNKEIPEELKKMINKFIMDDEIIYFYILSDVLLNAQYGLSLLTITNKRIISYDNSREINNGILIFDIDKIEKAEIKRMYGNAVFRIYIDGEMQEINKCSYSITELLDQIANYINDINKGKDRDLLIEIVYGTYVKRLLYCPQCGRRLQYPNAPCIKCSNKSKLLLRLFSYVKPYALILIIAMLMATVTTVMSLLPPQLTRELVDSTLQINDATTLDMVDKKLNDLFRIVMTLFALNTLSNIIGSIRGYMLRVASERIINSLKRELYTKAQYLPINYYDKTSTGSVISRINGDTGNLNGFIMRITQEVLAQAVQLVGIIVIMVLQSPVLSMLSLLPIPIVIIGSRIFSKFIYPFYYRIWKRGAKINSILADTLPGIKVVKAFTSEKKSINNFTNTTEDLISENLLTARITTVYNSVSGFVVMLGSLIIWGLGGYMVIKGENFGIGTTLSAGQLIAFINYMWMFYGPVQFFISLNETFISAFTSAERVFEVLDAEPEEDLGKGNIPEGGLKGKIEFKNVSFSYEKGKKILDSVNFTIEPGEIVGIVGTTGSGKSTIVNLMMRYYDTYEGEIYIDDGDIKEIDLNFYRSNVGYVLQEPLLFKDTVFRNIAHSDAEIPVEDVIYSAQVANAHSFITKLPDSYDTMLGERGVGLSGGERQRISIARAVLKDPSILILDEATASVDSETEHVIQEAIERIINGRTTIMIAHRLSTLKKADKIIVVEDGKIAEIGSHDDLMAAQGRYYKLVRIQSLAKDIIDSEGGSFSGDINKIL